MIRVTCDWWGTGGIRYGGSSAGNMHVNRRFSWTRLGHLGSSGCWGAGPGAGVGQGDPGLGSSGWNIL